MRVICSFVVLLGLISQVRAADPLVEPYLKEGRLTEGATALTEHLKQTPDDDNARFSLGIVRFLQSFEHVGQSLYKYGLRTGQVFRPNMPGLPIEVRQNPKPEKISYAELRGILQTWVDDLSAADAELAKVRDENVKVPLHVALIRIDLLGNGQPISAATVLGRMGDEAMLRRAEELVIAFDRGDASWLRGYVHFLSAWGELLLALDGQEMFDTTAHLFFEKPVVQHEWLLEETRLWDENQIWNNRPLITDVIAFFHVMRFELKEPERMPRVLSHLEATVSHGREMWKFINEEKDNDREWVPNSRQSSVVGVNVSEQMIRTWQDTLAEAQLVLEGKKLIPFWRGSKPTRGVNLRRAFTEPKPIDPFLWLQGTAATPYLETGPITSFRAGELVNRINQTFGNNFVGFAFWFN